jgi:O-antigen ligase/polysaccharide polymerase Wzy-like membrane protein
MLAIVPNPPLARERLAAGLVAVARLAFAALLFTSPFALRWTLLERRVGNVFSSYTDFSFYASYFFLLLILCLWVLSLISSPRPLRRGPWFLTWPIVGLVVLSWIGVVTGIDPALTLYHSVCFTLLLGLYLFLVNEQLAPIWVAVPLALGILLQAFVAFAQFDWQHSAGLAAWGELTLDPSDSGTSILRVGDVRILRAYGLTEHPNILGGFFALGLVLMLGYYLYMPDSPRGRYLFLVPLALGGVGLLLTFSRAAALAFLAGAGLLAIVVAWLPSTRSRRLMDIALAAFVMLTAAGLPIVVNLQLIEQRIGQGNSFVDNSNEQRSLAERDALMASANRIFNKYPIIGVGNGALPLAMYKFDDQFQKEYYYQPAHFVLLDSAAELGLPGGMFWLWLLVTPALALWFKRSQVLVNPWLSATLGALLVITIVGFYDYYPWLDMPGRLWQWSAWGLFGAAFQGVGKT